MLHVKLGPELLAQMMNLPCSTTSPDTRLMIVKLQKSHFLEGRKIEVWFRD